MPLTLGEQIMSASEPSGTQEVPATQPQEPVTQVKRTPYGAWGHGGPTDAGIEVIRPLTASLRAVS